LSWFRFSVVLAYSSLLACGFLLLDLNSTFSPRSISLRKSILRATALPVADYLAAFRRMPSTFRLSSLAALAARPERALSRHLVPRVNHDGLSFFDYAVKASTAAPLVEATDAAHATGVEMLAMAAAADAADALARTEAGSHGGANSSAGGSGGPSAGHSVAALSSAHPRLRALPALSTAAPALCVSLQLLKATGVPIPRDEAARAAIKQRVARLCLFEGNVPVSNVHVCECVWSPDREDEWVLDDEALAALRWNKVALRTKRKHALLCVELVAVVQPAVPMTPRQLADERASMRANAVEIVCAIAAVEIPRDKWAAQMAADGSDIELALPLVGGASIVSRTPIRADEVCARRPGFFASLFASSAPPASQLLVRVQPPARFPTRFATFLQCAPADVLVALQTTRALRLYRELVADASLRAPFTAALTAPAADALLPVAVSALSAPALAAAAPGAGGGGSGAHGSTHRQRAPHPFATALAVFARLVDAPELLHALDVLWEETRVLIDRSDRCDEKDGRASVAAKRAFARCVLNMLPAVQARSISGVVASSSSSSPSSDSSSSSSSSSSSTSWSFHAGVDTLPLAARVQHILHVVHLGRPALALNSDALTVEAAFASVSGAGSVQAALGGAAAVGLFGKTPAEVTAATGGGAVPVALNSHYAPFHTQQLMWDPLAGLEF
jgi:hypothetical protein